MLSLIAREMRMLFNEYRVAFILLMAAPTGYALLIGNLYGGHVVENIPVVVCDLDGSRASRALSREMGEADRHILVESTGEIARAEEMLERKEAVLAVVIPQNFARDTGAERPVRLAALIDNSNIQPGKRAAAAVQAVAASYNAELETRRIIAHGTTEIKPASLTLSLRAPGNPTGSYGFFYLYGVMLLASQFGILLCVGRSLYGDLERRALNRAAYLKSLLAKLLSVELWALISIGLGLTVLIGPFGLPFRGELWPAFILVSAFVLSASAMAVLVAAVAKSELAMVQCFIFYVLPAFIVSGYIWPAEQMTPPLRALSYLLPIHFAARDFRDMALLGTSAFWQRDALLLLLLTIIFLLPAVIKIRRRIS